MTATLDQLRDYTVLSLAPAAQYGVCYDLSDVSCAVSLDGVYVPVDLEWRVCDWRGNHVAGGTFAGVGSGETRKIQFTPPCYGSYVVSVSALYGDDRVVSPATILSVVPDGDRLPDAFADAELELIAWGKLGLARLNTDRGLDALADRIATCRRLGLPYVVQFVLPSDAVPDKCTEAATRFAGETWEVVNEPGGGSAIGADYVNGVLAPAYRALKVADPTCKVLGPNPVEVEAPSLAMFVAAGGLDFIDGLAVHDYQGHEQIDPIEWRRVGEVVRAALATRPGLPVWFTERAISCYRGGALTATVQAVYLMRRLNLLDSLGVPPARNCYYYAADLGFYECPSWLCGAEGLMPAILMTRFRGSLIGDAPFVGQLDFGPALNRCLHGLIHADDSRKVVTLYNFGCAPERVRLRVSQPGELDLFDAFGNHSTLHNDGVISVLATEVPTHLVLGAGATVEVVPENFAANLAVGARVECSAPHADAWADVSTVTDGTLQTQLGENAGRLVTWAAEADTLPVTVDVTLPAPQSLSRAIVWGLPADNAFCALLGYDLQAFVGGAWVTVGGYDDLVPAAYPGRTPYASAMLPNGMVQHYAGRCFCIHRFAPVTTDRIRLVVRRASYGLATDDGLSDAVPNWQRNLPRLVMIREIELYA